MSKTFSKNKKRLKIIHTFYASFYSSLNGLCLATFEYKSGNVTAEKCFRGIFKYTLFSLWSTKNVISIISYKRICVGLSQQLFSMILYSNE